VRTDGLALSDRTARILLRRKLAPRGRQGKRRCASLESRLRV